MFDYFLGILAFALLGIVVNAIKILREYERGVIFQLGRFWKVKGPGLIIVIPIIQQIERVDLRVVVMDVPTQDVISRDNVSVMVNAVVYFRVIEPDKAIIAVEKYLEAVSQLAQTTLRSVLGQHELDDMLSERDKLNKDIQTILDRQTDAWGIKVANVEIKHVDLDESMIRAIAKGSRADAPRSATGEKRQGVGRGRAYPERKSRCTATAVSSDPDGDRRRTELDDRLPAGSAGAGEEGSGIMRIKAALAATWVPDNAIRVSGMTISP